MKNKITVSLHITGCLICLQSPKTKQVTFRIDTTPNLTPNHGVGLASFTIKKTISVNFHEHLSLTRWHNRRIYFPMTCGNDHSVCIYWNFDYLYDSTLVNCMNPDDTALAQQTSTHES